MSNTKNSSKVTKYVILHTLPNWYWCGGENRIGKIEIAKRYLPEELPKRIQRMMLYKPTDTPSTWKYISMCGKTAKIEEIEE